MLVRVDPYWIRQVERIAPRDRRGSFFRVVFDRAWKRWVVYQLVEPVFTPRPLWESTQRAVWFGDLLAPMPGHGRVRIAHERMSVTQWELYQRTGCYGQPYWIVQGDHGGHKRQWDRAEAFLSFRHGRPEQPPEPGALPYAPVDRRVVAGLRAQQKAEEWKAMVAWGKRNVDRLDDVERATIQNVKRALVDWVKDTVDHTFDALPETAQHRAAQQFKDRATRTGPSTAGLLERAEQSFVNTPL